MDLREPRFFEGKYAKDHWCMNPPKLGDKGVIATVQHPNLSSELEFVVFLNPTDRSGYRCLVSLVNRVDPSLSLNRPASLVEGMVLGVVLELVAEAYRKIVPVAQTCVLGNNSQSLEKIVEGKVGRVVQNGNEEEPFVVHGHVFGRGDPFYSYIGDVSLGGSDAGELFGLRGVHQKWAEEEIVVVGGALKKELRSLVEKEDKVVSSFSLQISF